MEKPRAVYRENLFSYLGRLFIIWDYQYQWLVYLLHKEVNIHHLLFQENDWGVFFPVILPIRGYGICGSKGAHLVPKSLSYFMCLLPEFLTSLLEERSQDALLENKLSLWCVYHMLCTKSAIYIPICISKYTFSSLSLTHACAHVSVRAPTLTHTHTTTHTHYFSPQISAGFKSMLICLKLPASNIELRFGIRFFQSIFVTEKLGYKLHVLYLL